MDVDVESPKVTKYRDTAGPGLDGWFGMREKGKELATTTPQGKRDVELMHLMHDYAQANPQHDPSET
jgi:hypothetical protein